MAGIGEALQTVAPPSVERGVSPSMESPLASPSVDLAGQLETTQPGEAHDVLADLGGLGSVSELGFSNEDGVEAATPLPDGVVADSVEPAQPSAIPLEQSWIGGGVAQPLETPVDQVVEPDVKDANLPSSVAEPGVTPPTEVEGANGEMSLSGASSEGGTGGSTAADGKDTDTDTDAGGQESQAGQADTPHQERAERTVDAPEDKQQRMQTLQAKINSGKFTDEELQEFQKMKDVDKAEGRKAELQKKIESGDFTKEEAEEWREMNKEGAKDGAESQGEEDAGSEQAEPKEPTAQEQMQQLDKEDDQITQEMMEGKDFEQNKAKLQQNYEKRRGLRDIIAIKMQEQSQKLRREMGETRYQQELRELQAGMAEALRRILSLPEEYKKLQDARKKLVKEYKDAEGKFKLNSENAKKEETVEHFNNMRRLGSQIGRITVAMAEVKLGVKLGVDEFNALKNRFDRLVGAKGFWSYLGGLVVNRMKQELNEEALDHEARKIAQQAA